MHEDERAEAGERERTHSTERGGARKLTRCMALYILRFSRFATAEKKKEIIRTAERELDELEELVSFFSFFR